VISTDGLKARTLCAATFYVNHELISCSSLGLGAADVLLLEEKLAIEICDINGIKINLKMNKAENDPFTTVICLNPQTTKFLSSSQPMPPAPTTRTLVPSSLPKKDSPITCTTKTSSRWIELTEPMIFPREAMPKLKMY
jgi:hypothetical protein